MMNLDNNIRSTGIHPSVINPGLMNGNNNIATDKKTNKNAKVTLDKNGKPKRKKASRGMSCFELKKGRR
jgi:hypothetical protein